MFGPQPRPRWFEPTEATERFVIYLHGVMVKPTVLAKGPSSSRTKLVRRRGLLREPSYRWPSQGSPSRVSLRLGSPGDGFVLNTHSRCGFARAESASIGRQRRLSDPAALPGEVNRPSPGGPKRRAKPANGPG